MEGFRIACSMKATLRHEMELPACKVINDKLALENSAEGSFLNLPFVANPGLWWGPGFSPTPILKYPNVEEFFGLKWDFLIREDGISVIVTYNSLSVSGIDVSSSLTFHPYKTSRRLYKSAKSGTDYRCVLRYPYSELQTLWKPHISAKVMVEFQITLQSVSHCVESGWCTCWGLLEDEELPKTMNAAPFFMSTDMSDVTISVGDVNYPGHKLVLAASSDVFKRILQSEMKEAKENRIEMPDVEPAAVKEMLRFLYTRKCQARPDLLVDLFKLSHVYQIWMLQSITCKRLLNTVSLDNAAEMYTLGELYGKESLSKKALDLAEGNKDHFWRNPELMKILTTNYPNFLVELSRL